MPLASLDPMFDPAANTLQFTAGEDDDLVVVGNAERADRCEARVELGRWGMRPLVWTFDHSSTEPTFIDDKLLLPGTDRSVRIYRDTPDSTEVELILHKRPANGRFQFGIENYTDLEFIPQPALTEAERSEGWIRAPEFEDSIAVYHATKAGNQYRAGKWGHFKRATARDRDGNQIWGTTTFADGTLTLEFDSSWITTAALPITIGPNLGVDTIGALFFNSAARFVLQNRNITAGATGTASKLWVYTNTDSDRVKLALYDGTGGGTRLSISYEIASPVPTSQWNSVDILAEAIPVTDPDPFHVAFAFEANGHGFTFDTGGATNDLLFNSAPTAYASQMVDPGEDNNNTPLILSAYLEFDVAGLGGRTEILGGGIL